MTPSCVMFTLCLYNIHNALNFLSSHTDKAPNLKMLNNIKHNGKTISVVTSMKGGKWKELARELGLPESTVNEIHEREPSSIRVYKMFERWTSGSGGKSVTWRALIEALKRAEMGDLANELRAAVDTKY